MTKKSAELKSILLTGYGQRWPLTLQNVMLETIISCYGRQWTKINIKERTTFIQASATPQKTVNITRNALRLHSRIEKGAKLTCRKFEWIEMATETQSRHHKLNHAVACQILTCHCLCSVDLLPHTSAVDPVFYPAFRDNKPDGSSCPMPIFSAPVKCRTIRIAFVQLKYGQKSIFLFALFICKWNGRSLILFGSFWVGLRGECKNHCQRTRQKQKRNKQAKEREAKKAHKIYKTYNMVHTAYQAHKIQNEKKTIQKHKSVVPNG